MNSVLLCQSLVFYVSLLFPYVFPASNGDPRTPQSLHYIDPSGRPNAYQQVGLVAVWHANIFLKLKAFLLNHLMYQAILGVSEVLQFYDSDRRFPAWGFGAKIPQGFISHCFNLNATTNDCEVSEIHGWWNTVCFIWLISDNVCYQYESFPINQLLDMYTKIELLSYKSLFSPSRITNASHERMKCSKVPFAFRC
jgi:hypothetical protein